jgi:membrane-bound inhibitor of C-type lysozyme
MPMHSKIVAAIAVAALGLSGCQSSGPTKEEEEAARSTVECDHAGQRILIRFAEGEARLLMPDATRVILYQVPVPSGLRYTNGLWELRGRDLTLELSQDRQTVRMICKPYELPKKQ